MCVNSYANPNLISKDLIVTGVVLDSETREQLIGVNIISKETSDGTVTEYDGSFTLQVEEGNTLIFSYLGCLLYTSPSPRDATLSRMPSSA